MPFLYVLTADYIQREIKIRLSSRIAIMYRIFQLCSQCVFLIDSSVLRHEDSLSVGSNLKVPYYKSHE